MRVLLAIIITLFCKVAAAQENVRTLVLDPSSLIGKGLSSSLTDRDLSLERIIATWSVHANRLSPLAVHIRVRNLLLYGDREYPEINASGQLDSARVGCNFPGTTAQCRRPVEELLNRVLVSESPYRKVSATEASFLFNTWLYSFTDNYHPSVVVFDTPYLSYNRYGRGGGQSSRAGDFMTLGLGLRPVGEVTNGSAAFSAIEELFRSGEIFQCWEGQSICNQLWRLTSSTEGNANRDFYAVCKIFRSSDVAGRIPFDCVPLALRNGESRMVLAILEYLLPKGEGGTDLGGAVQFDNQLSEQHLREIISAATEAMGLPPTRGESNSRRLISQSPGAVRAPGSSEWVLREFVITYRQSLEQEWILDIWVQTGFSQFQGFSHIRLGTGAEDRATGDTLVQHLRRICRERASQTGCRIVA